MQQSDDGNARDGCLSRSAVGWIRRRQVFSKSIHSLWFDLVRAGFYRADGFLQLRNSCGRKDSRWCRYWNTLVHGPNVYLRGKSGFACCSSRALHADRPSRRGANRLRPQTFEALCSLWNSSPLSLASSSCFTSQVYLAKYPPELGEPLTCPSLQTYATRHIASDWCYRLPFLLQMVPSQSHAANVILIANCP
jgi:hypothetical protein